jgi:hypothetical protein
MLLDVIINMLPRILIYLFHVLESFVSKDLINFFGWSWGLNSWPCAYYLHAVLLKQCPQCILLLVVFK